ncbi:MAG: ATP-binding protein [Chloroflexi bacterium]|nr:ATP-binding protein [Chloroflexota bacterium]MCY4246178.1 ATP-binding protein [Chloroflexota bacterium]
MAAVALILFALSLGLAIAARRRQREIIFLEASLASRDEAIRRLRAQLRVASNERADAAAMASAVTHVSFDSVMVLDEDAKLLVCKEPTTNFCKSSACLGEPLPTLINVPDLLELVELTLREDEGSEEHFVVDERHYRARTRMLRIGGQRFVGLAIQDISELVSLNRSRRDMVANISHELRTPITRIRLIIDSLFLDADKPKRKASIQSLKEIAMETDALLWLSQELLDLSMIESGQKILRMVPMPLKQIIDEASERFDAQAEMKDLTIVSHVPARLGALCDADQLKRALGNLIHNAIKWSPTHGAITITAAERADEIVVSVFDNGPGVSEALRERIFERFYQGDSSRSGDEGTGLGLAICKHIVEAHGGRIWAESNSQGRGGRFGLTLLKADSELLPDAIDAGELQAQGSATSPPE